VPAADVTVTLPAPITITGSSMGLSLDMLVSKSASYEHCDTSGGNSFSITPNFTVAPVTIAAQPTNTSNGKMSGLEGVITAVNSDSGGFSVNSVDDGPAWQIASNGSTVFQGIPGSSQLAVGMPVDMDMTIQADGSLLATRIAVYDTDTTNVSFWYGGGLINVTSSNPEAAVYGRQQVGPILASDALWFDFSGTTFNISGQLSNLASLPFQASFSAANMVAGQNIAVTTHDTSVGPNGPSATTITLLPQTINGTVSAVYSEGSFTTYTVTLAAYDLFPTFAVQADQTTLLTNPNTVVVYADSNTQQLNTNPVAVGSVVRFYGLVFNDNGTLRMDCAQINDGVPE
jgi:hypothetical protein